MQWLTALLAFATTMLIFAIVVSTLVEMIHRIWKLRADGLRVMLENLFTQVIKPCLATDSTLTPQGFAKLIMTNRAVNSTPPKKDAAANSGNDPKPNSGPMSKLLHKLIDSPVMTDIPVEVFTQKLADSEVVGKADKITDEVLTDIAQKYEAFGQEMSIYFERRARLFSVCVAIVVAWMFYVHPYKLATTYLKNPEIAQRVADKSGETLAKYAVLQTKLDDVTKKNPALAGVGDLTKAVDDLKKKMEETGEESHKLENLGAPLGWPAQTSMNECNWSLTLVSEICKFDVLGNSLTWPSFGGMFWLVLGGLLIGLGAPFWAKAITSLTSTRDVTNKIAEIVAPKKYSFNAGASNLVIARDATENSVALAAFKVSREADKSKK